MALVLPSVEDQYKKFPQLDRSDVLELQEWQKTQPHLPKITGEYHIFVYNFVGLIIVCCSMLVIIFCLL